MITIDTQLLASVSQTAKNADRKRTNHNFHKNGEDLLQRMINALQPGTYVQPHKHENPDKREIFILLSGSLAVIEFDDAGNMTEHTILSAKTGNLGVEIAPRVYHTIICLEPDTAVYEMKDGPYSQANDKNFAPWAPAEGDKECAAYNQKLMQSLGLTLG